MTTSAYTSTGAKVDWDGDTETVTGTKDSTIVILAIGSTSPTINGEVVTIDQPGVIVDGRTLAPLRFVAEAFGGDVAWDGDTQTASITMGGTAAITQPVTTASTPGDSSDVKLLANSWKYSYVSSGQMFQTFYFFNDDGTFVNDHLGLWPRKFIGNYYTSGGEIFFTNIKVYHRRVGSAIFGYAGIDEYTFYEELQDLTSQYEFNSDGDGDYLRIATVYNQTQLGYVDSSNLKIHRVSTIVTGEGG